MKQHKRAGFTLLELIVVMSLLALLAGVVAPSIGSKIRSDGKRVTRQKLALLAEASVEHYRDTGQFPANALELMASSTAGWAGPYLSGTVEDPWSGQSGYVVDAFGTDFDFQTAGLQLTIRSAGPDRILNNTDDIPLVVDGTPVLRAETLDRIAAANTAIQQYNSVYLSTAPLPANWATAYSMLVSRGFLPTGGAEANDAWGDAFEADPAGASPLVRIRSTNM